MCQVKYGAGGRAVHKLLQFSQKVAQLSCSKSLKVAQKLPQNPKVAQKLLSIF